MESREVLSAPDAARTGFQKEALSVLLRVLFPMVPHICQAVWDELGFAGELQDAEWPKVDESALVLDEIELVLQVNGKLRGKLLVAADADREAIEKAAVDHPGALRYVEGKTIRKVVVVPGRLVNIVA